MIWPFTTINHLRAERDAAVSKLEQARFRNPATGRLGKKGQTFD